METMLQVLFSAQETSTLLPKAMLQELPWFTTTIRAI